MSMNPSIESLHASDDESGIEALNRYDQIISVKHPEFENEKKVQRKPPDSPDLLKSVESLLGFSLPHKYKEFLLSHGGFIFGSDQGVFNLYSGSDLINILNHNATEKFACRLGVIDFVNYLWEGRDDLNEALSEPDVCNLNSEYYVIGLIHVDSNAHRYIFMNRSNQCGVFHYDQDYLDELLESHLTPMLKGNFAAQDFDKLLASEIQRCIRLLK